MVLRTINRKLIDSNEKPLLLFEIKPSTIHNDVYLERFLIKCTKVTRLESIQLKNKSKA